MRRVKEITGKCAENLQAQSYRAITVLLAALVLAAALLAPGPGNAGPLEIRDDSGAVYRFDKSPCRVVSLVPSLTEILFRIGAQDALQALTYESILPSGASKKTIVGSSSNPSIERIEAAFPDLILICGLHDTVRKHFLKKDIPVLQLETTTVDSGFKQIQLLGKLFGKEEAARSIIRENSDLIALIGKKIARIPLDQRKRIMRVVAGEEPSTPGAGSFQNEMISLAGGIPPSWDSQGAAVSMTETQFTAFNPQVLYGCDEDRQTMDAIKSRNGWNSCEAVTSGQIYYFPCELACRTATHVGDFVSWLASRIYGDEFSGEANRILPETTVSSRSLSLQLPYVRDARIAFSDIYDFRSKTLMVSLEHPMAILSTLEGPRDGILTVGNHYMPPQTWGLGHITGVDELKRIVLKAVGKDSATTSFLFTGADMDNLSVQTQKFKDMDVRALVTAGVSSNALRMSRETGGYYEPGTINIIILTNMQLTSRAMSRAVISATEAKTAALLDLDIRSSYQPGLFGATGTGTDNIIVVQGEGVPIDNAGGHSKMGELIARAVYDGVKEAVYLQNGLDQGRSIFQRLKERRIPVTGLVSCEAHDCNMTASDISIELEKLLLDPHYAGFMAVALTLSDDYEQGLVKDISFFRQTAQGMAGEIAGRPLPELKDMVRGKALPLMIRTALNALANGIASRSTSP
ncbi:MAG: adenosylcobinamide amidohydrolase [Pseudomonadota bacterium]